MAVRTFSVAAEPLNERTPLPFGARGTAVDRRSRRLSGCGSVRPAGGRTHSAASTSRTATDDHRTQHVHFCADLAVSRRLAKTQPAAATTAGGQADSTLGGSSSTAPSVRVSCTELRGWRRQMKVCLRALTSVIVLGLVPVFVFVFV